MAGLTEIPAIIVDFDDDQMAEISLLENIQRENLTAIEEAKGYKTLKEDGTAVYVTPENNDIRAYIWKETSYGVFLNGKSDMKLTDEEGMLKTKLFGFVTLNFVKEEK